MNKLLSGVTIAQGGVLPNIQAILLPKKTAEVSTPTTGGAGSSKKKPAGEKASSGTKAAEKA